MYILEITTADSRETLLKRETAETWKEINDLIDDMQDLAFDNIKIDIYKQTEENDPEYLGDFSNIKRGQLLETPKTKKKNDSLIVGLAGLLMFPIMVINRLVKK